MAEVEAPQVYELAASEVRTVAADFTPLLETGEQLSGSPEVDEIGGSSLTLGTPAINVSNVEIIGETVGPSLAVQFSVSTPIADMMHRVRVRCTTNGTPAQTLVQTIRVMGVRDA